MTSAKCFLGCTNVRYGARIVSILDFWIGVLLLIKCLTLLNPFYDDNYYNNHNSRADQTSYDLVIFSHLFLISVLLNVNYHLKESTYDHKVHKIYQWLAINTIFLSFYILAITYITIKNYYPEILYYSIPVSIIHLCQIYVVKSFYDDELHIISSLSTTVSAAEHNNVTTALHQNSSQGSVNVTLSGPSAPNPVYLVQSAPLQQQQEAGRPHCINRVAHPVPLPGTISTIYPQLHHDQSRHDGPEPHFQVEPSSEVQHPQQYYNPPAYSPAYDQQAKMHCVRMI